MRVIEDIGGYHIFHFTSHFSRLNDLTFFTSFCLMTLSVSGCVVISNNKKFCFSVVSTPFSTRFLANLSRTLRNWNFSFSGFQVSPATRTFSILKHVTITLEIWENNWKLALYHSNHGNPHYSRCLGSSRVIKLKVT